MHGTLNTFGGERALQLQERLEGWLEIDAEEDGQELIGFALAHKLYQTPSDEIYRRFLETKLAMVQSTLMWDTDDGTDDNDDKEEIVL